MRKSHIKSVLQTLAQTPRVKPSRTWDREYHTESPRTAILAPIVRLTIRHAMAQCEPDEYIGTLAPSQSVLLRRDSKKYRSSYHRSPQRGRSRNSQFSASKE